MELLRDFIIVLFSSVIILLVLSRLKVPAIIGFLITGILIGPFFLSLVKASGQIVEIAEIGIMLLMFNIGLEFSIGKIRSMKHEMLVLGGLQVAVTAVIVCGIMLLAGNTIASSVFSSFIIALSSTAIILKMLQDSRQIQAPWGRKMTGILLFQDLSAVPFIIFTPMLTVSDPDLLNIVYSLGKSVVLIVLIFFCSKYLLPRIFDFIVGLRIPELFMSLVLCLCIGLALLTHSLGFSLALGSFIAGMVLAESDYIHQIEADINPLKNVFLSVFFVSVGMLLDLNYVSGNWLNILLGTLGIIVLKTVVMFSIAHFFRNPLNMSILLGLGLSQIGEFAFLLLNLADPLNILTETQQQFFLSASVFSMLATPALLHLGNQLMQRDNLKKEVQHQESFLRDHVIVAGYGVNGKNVTSVFKAINIPYSIVEINPHTVKKFKSEGENIVFGDINKPENLIQLGIERARMIIVAISDNDAAFKAVRLVRKLNRDIIIIARTDFLSQREPLLELGADVVVAQDVEASVEIIRHALHFVGIQGSLAEQKIKSLRLKIYDTYPKEKAGIRHTQKVNEVYLVTSGNGLIDQKITALKNSWESSRVVFLGLARDNVIMTSFLGDDVFREGDLLLFYGEYDEVQDLLTKLDFY